MKFRDDLPDSGGGSFLRLKDKESIVGVFVGDLHEFFTLWKDKVSTIVPEGTSKASFRFRVNFVIKEGDGYVAKIFEQGKTVYKQLLEINKEYPLETIAVKITRQGSGVSDTEYFFMPMLKTPVSEAVYKVQLLQLDKDKAAEPVADQGFSEEMGF